MSADAKYPISAAAVMVGKPGPRLPITTIRNWTREYARHLSADANPLAGTERRYTERDVAVLRLVHEWREGRIPTSDIHDRLQDATIPVMDVLPADESTESPPEATTIASEPLQLPSPVLNDLVTRLQGVESLDRRVSSLESRRSMILVAVASFAVGAVVVAVIAWLVIAWLLTMLR
jgi:DNA-binding transcriptional MerR regulator